MTNLKKEIEQLEIDFNVRIKALKARVEDEKVVEFVMDEPESSCEFYFDDGTGLITDGNMRDEDEPQSPWVAELLANFNCFPTEHEAELFSRLSLPERKLAYALKKLHGDDWDTWIDWDTTAQRKHFILQYEQVNDNLKTEWNCTSCARNNLLHAKSEEILNQAIKMIGDETARQSVGYYGEDK